MKRFHFPFDYKPKIDFKNTLKYSSILKQLLFNHFYEKYRVIYVDPTLLVTTNKSAGAHTSNDRIFSFDNKAANTIVALNNAQDNYFMIASSYLKNQNLLSYCPFIKRDADLTNTSSMMYWIMNLELAMPLDTINDAYFAQLIKSTYAEIIQTTRDENLRRIYLPLTKKTRPYGYSTITVQKLEDQYPTLTLNEALRHYCSQHNFTIVLNSYKKTKNNQWLSDSILTAVDFDCCASLYVYDTTNDQAINLINVVKRPNGDKSLQQLKTYNPIELSSNLYDDRIFDESRPTNISLSINFTNLIYYLLDKVHLAEVVSSIWPDDFIEFVRAAKIEIF